MRLELQRLLARGPGGLPLDVLVDVGAFLRRVHEVELAADPWPELLAYAARSHRRLTWVVAGPSDAGLVSEVDFNEVLTRPLAAAANVIVSTEPLAALLANIRPGVRVGVLSAGLALASA